MARNVLASYYDGKKGYKGDDLYKDLYYSELSNRLGGLPYKHKLRITYKGKSAVGKKGDTGTAGSKNPAIDIHKKLAEKLKFPRSVENVTIKNA